MQLSSAPAKFGLVWAQNAAGAYIRTVPQTSQIGITAGAASYNDGFVPDNFVQIAAGGVPPFGQDMNGALNEITSWSQWQQAGGTVSYDSAFATSVGGYPKRAVIASSVVLGNFWLNTVDGNTTDPDSTGSSGWVPLPGMFQTGSLYYTVTSTAPQGWVLAMFGVTIGNPLSGASYAAADAFPLFSFLWLNFPNTQCAVTPSGRGANPAADFAANKAIQTLDMSGTGIIGQDSSTGRLTGVPVVSGNPNAAGAIVGENLHALIIGELPAHAHSASGSTATESIQHSHTGGGTTSGTSVDHSHVGAVRIVAGIFPGGGGSGIDGGNQTGGQSVDHSHTYSFTTGLNGQLHTHGYNLTTTSVGSNAGHNTVSRNLTVNWLLKL